MGSLIFNNNEPMFSPNLKSGKPETCTIAERMAVKAELDLMDTSAQWYAKGNKLADSYKELAMVYAVIYDDKIALSSLLVTFSGAVIQLEVDRKKYVESKGETEKTTDAYNRNQMFMRVHQETAGMIQKNDQMMLMLKNALEKVMQYSKENQKLKAENEAIKKAWEAA